MDKDIILVDKPKGISSFDVIRILRKQLGIRKMGHAGTLDPLASGLMIIGIGNKIGFRKGLLKLSNRRKGLDCLFDMKNGDDQWFRYSRSWKNYRKFQYV